MGYKIFACDLDGTLLDDNSNVSKDNFDAIEQMTKDGIEFALCTGRTFYEIPQSLRDFQSIRYIIYSDGSVIFDKKKNKNVYEHYIDMQTLIRLYNLLSSYDTMIEFYENKEPQTDKSKLNINSYHYYKIDENYIDSDGSEYSKYHFCFDFVTLSGSTPSGAAKVLPGQGRQQKGPG